MGINEWGEEESDSESEKENEIEPENGRTANANTVRDAFSRALRNDNQSVRRRSVDLRPAAAKQEIPAEQQQFVIQLLAEMNIEASFRRGKLHTNPRVDKLTNSVRINGVLLEYGLGPNPSYGKIMELIRDEQKRNELKARVAQARLDVVREESPPDSPRVTAKAASSSSSDASVQKESMPPPPPPPPALSKREPAAKLPRAVPLPSKGPTSAEPNMDSHLKSQLAGRRVYIEDDGDDAGEDDWDEDLSSAPNAPKAKEDKEAKEKERKILVHAVEKEAKAIKKNIKQHLKSLQDIVQLSQKAPAQAESKSIEIINQIELLRLQLNQIFIALISGVQEPTDKAANLDAAEKIKRDLNLGNLEIVMAQAIVGAKDNIEKAKDAFSKQAAAEQERQQQMQEARRQEEENRMRSEEQRLIQEAKRQQEQEQARAKMEQEETARQEQAKLAKLEEQLRKTQEKEREAQLKALREAEKRQAKEQAAARKRAEKTKEKEKIAAEKALKAKRASEALIEIQTQRFIENATTTAESETTDELIRAEKLAEKLASESREAAHQADDLVKHGKEADLQAIEEQDRAEMQRLREEHIRLEKEHDRIKREEGTRALDKASPTRDRLEQDAHAQDEARAEQEKGRIAQQRTLEAERQQHDIAQRRSLRQEAVFEELSSDRMQDRNEVKAARERQTSQRQEISAVFGDLSHASNNAVEGFFANFGNGKGAIERHLKDHYQGKRTEKKLKGLMQSFAISHNKVFTNKRNKQMVDLALIIDKLQQDNTLNNNEKAVILNGALQSIIDNIQSTEVNNKFKSRLKTISEEYQDALKGWGMAKLDSNASKILYHTYNSEGGAESFRKIAKSIVESQAQPGRRP